MEASFALQVNKALLVSIVLSHAILRKKECEVHQFYYLMKSLLTWMREKIFFVRVITEP